MKYLRRPQRTFLKNSAEVNLDTIQGLTLRLVDTHCPGKNKWKLYGSSYIRYSLRNESTEK